MYIFATYMTACNICCTSLWTLHLPEDGHILWPKHVEEMNDKYCAMNWALKLVCISYSSCSWLNKARILDYPYFSIAHTPTLPPLPPISQDNLYSSRNLRKTPYSPTLTQTARSAIRTLLSRQGHRAQHKGWMTKQSCCDSPRRQHSGFHLIRRGPKALSPGRKDYHLHVAMSLRMR